MASTKPRIQVTVDSELAAALAELGAGRSRSAAVRELALRGAESMRVEREAAVRAREHLEQIAAGADDRYDFAVAEALHRDR